MTEKDMEAELAPMLAAERGAMAGGEPQRRALRCTSMGLNAFNQPPYAEDIQKNLADRCGMLTDPAPGVLRTLRLRVAQAKTQKTVGMRSYDSGMADANQSTLCGRTWKGRCVEVSGNRQRLIIKIAAT